MTGPFSNCERVSMRGLSNKFIQYYYVTFFSRGELQQQSRFNTEYKLQPYGFVDAAMENQMEIETT